MSRAVVRTLADVADIRVSNVDKKSLPDERAVTLCNYMDVYANDYITAGLPFMEATAAAAEQARFGLAKGDVLLTKDSESPDDIGVPAVVTEDIDGLVCGYHLAMARPDTRQVDPQYLCKQLGSPAAARYFAQRAAGSTRYGLSLATLRNIPVPLPPIEHQQRIGSILRTADTAIEKTEALIHKYQQIEAGLMHDLFTRGIGPDGQLRSPREQAPELYQETPIGWIPIEWAEIPAATVLASAVDGPFGSNLKTEHYVPAAGVRVVRLQNIQESEYNDLDRAFVSEAHAGSLLRHQVLPGDILVAGLGEERYPVGRSCVYPDQLPPAINKADCCRIRADSTLALNHYVSLFLNSALARRQIRRYEQGVTRPRINLGNLKRVSVTLPSLPEQQMIVDRLKSASAQVDSYKWEKRKLQKLKAGLMTALLSSDADPSTAAKLKADV